MISRNLNFIILILCVFTLPSECKYRDLDVAFLLDKSTSLMTQTNFNKELVFVSDFLNEIDIDSGSAQVSVMTFSDDPKVEFRLNKYHSRFEVEQGLLNVKYTYGNTFTDRAVKTLIDDVLAPGNGARQGVTTVIIIITDGKSTDPYSLADQTARLHRKRATVFAIGKSPRHICTVMMLTIVAKVKLHTTCVKMHHHHHHCHFSF